MPIRFHCKRCDQLLGIASRKAGSEVQCPKCGFGQIVPSEEAAAAALALGRVATASPAVGDLAELVVYEDDPAPIDMRIDSGRRTEPRPPDRQPDAEEPAVPPPPQAGRPVPRGMILFPRRTYYLQAVLFLVVAALAFGSGYLIGRGDGSYDKQVEQERAVRQKVLVQGRLLFDPGTGQPSGDENAVVMALPQGEYPKQLLSIQGVRPQDPPPGQEHPTVRSIVELGGDYARANASGGFDLVVPAEGKYWLLLISAHAARATNEPVGEADLAEIDRYFQLGEHLLNRYKYRWRLEEIRVGFNPIEIDFGQDQKSS